MRAVVSRLVSAPPARAEPACPPRSSMCGAVRATHATLREFGRRATLTPSCRANPGAERGIPVLQVALQIGGRQCCGHPSRPDTMPRLVVALALLASVSLSIAAHAQQPRVLVFSKTTGFRHSSIPNGIAAMKKLGQENGFAVDATEEAGAFTEQNLARYGAVVLDRKSVV